MSRTRKWSCRVTAVAELLTGGGGGGGGEARPAAPRGHCRGSSRQPHGAYAGPRQPASLSPPVRPSIRFFALRVRGGLVCILCRASGAAAPRGPVGVPGRARPLARSPTGTMMEEIDRFQVPTAHSEMQPLVRGRAAGRPGPGGAPPERREGTRPWGWCEGAPSDKAGGAVKTHCRGRESCRGRKPWGDYLR